MLEQFESSGDIHWPSFNQDCSHCSDREGVKKAFTAYMCSFVSLLRCSLTFS